LGGFTPVLLGEWFGDYSDLLDRTARTGRLEEAGNDVIAAASEDSYESFVRKNSVIARSWEELRKIENARNTKAAAQQTEWETQQRARQQQQQTEADQAWRKEEERRHAEHRVAESASQMIQHDLERQAAERLARARQEAAEARRAAEQHAHHLRVGIPAFALPQPKSRNSP
jgi:hypothetical protein